jgi:hypothetical protein
MFGLSIAMKANKLHLTMASEPLKSVSDVDISYSLIFGRIRSTMKDLLLTNSTDGNSTGLISCWSFDMMGMHHLMLQKSREGD